MALALQGIDPVTDQGSASIDCAVAMHGTSAFRRESAKLMAEILEATGAHGVAFGWSDALAPHLLAPIHSVFRTGPIRWDDRLSHTIALTVEVAGGLTWRLMMRGVETDASDPCSELVAAAQGWFAGAGRSDVPSLHPAVAESTAWPWIARLDAYRACGFHIERSSDVAPLRADLLDQLPTLPARCHPAGRVVADALGRPERFGHALTALGTELDLAGALSEAVSVQVIAYESALLRGDASGCIDAARAAGRAHRKLAEWDEAFRWYRLAADVAETRGDRSRWAVVLDGLGNTHRQKGAFAEARASYERAWGLARASGDPAAVGAVGHSLMIVEREAGRLESAAAYGLEAIRVQPDRERRARLLIDLGTLLVDAGDASIARRAYRLASHLTTDGEMRALALDAVAYTLALRGEWTAYERAARTARRAARTATVRLRAQMGFYRGRALWLAGRDEAARRVLAATERLADDAGLSMWSVKSGELSDAIARGDRPPTPAVREAPAEVRQGISALEVEVGV